MSKHDKQKRTYKKRTVKPAEAKLSAEQHQVAANALANENVALLKINESLRKKNAELAERANSNATAKASLARVKTTNEKLIMENARLSNELLIAKGRIDTLIKTKNTKGHIVAELESNIEEFRNKSFFSRLLFASSKAKIKLLKHYYGQ